MRRVRRADQQGMRRVRRPARQVGGAEIRRVELGAGDLGHAVDAAGAGGGRIPAAAVPAASRARETSARTGASATGQA